MINDRSISVSLGPNQTIIVQKHWKPMREGEFLEPTTIHIEVHPDRDGRPSYHSDDLEKMYGHTQFRDLANDIKKHFSQEQHSTDWEHN